MAVILGVGVGGGVLGSLLAPRLGLLLGGLAAMVAGWGLRFQPSPDATAWRRGAAGERRTARLLGPLEGQGWVVFHDLAVPGSRAKLDDLVIGPGGVVVIDSKFYRGRLQLDGSGRLWHGRYPLAPTLRAVSFEADKAAQVLTDRDVVVVPVMAVPRSLEALGDQLGGLSATQPVIVTYEDTHWIDPTTLELLGLAIDRINRLRVLLVITFRPEFAAPWSRRIYPRPPAPDYRAGGPGRRPAAKPGPGGHRRRSGAPMS